MRLHTFSISILSFAFALAGCSGDTTGLNRLDPEFNRTPLPGISVALTVASNEFAAGDTVRLVVTATNSTNQRVEATGGGCGPVMDVAIGHPDDTVELLLEGLMFTCELRPEHVYEPGQSHTLQFSWIAPAEAGEYVAVAGLRRSGGLSNPSSPVRLTVR